MNTPTFAELFIAHTGNVSSKWAQYLEVYERYFAPHRNKHCRILEIGVQNGGSLQLYQKYFPRAEKIVGIDINPKCKRVESGNIHIEIGSQTDRDFLNDVNATHGPFDIVIDDGSHVFDHQIASFETLFPQLSPTGVYIVEDTHTSYLPDFGGDIRKQGTFIEYGKLVLDQVNAPFFADPGNQTAWLAEHLYSVSFYDSMVVFEKRPKAAPFALAIGSEGHRQVPSFQDLAYFRKKHSLR
ncbi:class I SAM-dependent methyltransferase [Polaromonas sp.]|uniref:class I SAM-dependent methyltransferase n=1 Tax=Polaromonas sp. TaxID=1869339 RepID=UPI003567F1DB